MHFVTCFTNLIVQATLMSKKAFQQQLVGYVDIWDMLFYNIPIFPWLCNLQHRSLACSLASKENALPHDTVAIR